MKRNHKASPPSASPLRIVFLYSLFSAFYIIWSDRLMVLLVPHQLVETVSVLKGCGFIVVTALLLYHFIGRQFAGIARLATESAENSERLQMLEDNLPDSYVYQHACDADGSRRFLHFSAGFDRFHGLRREDVLRDPTILYRQVDPEQAAALAAAEDASLQDMAAFQLELRIHRADGEWRWLRLSSCPRRKADGQIVWDGIATDVTGQKESELRLCKLNRIQALLSTINQTILRIHKPQELFNAACRIAVEQAGFRMAWIGLLDLQSQEVKPVAHAGETGNYLERLKISISDPERGHGPTASAQASGRHVVVNDIANDPAMSPWRDSALELGYRASAAFPLCVAGQMRGTLNLYATEPYFFDDEELELLDEMAANIAFALSASEEEEERRRIQEMLVRSEAGFQHLSQEFHGLLDAIPDSLMLLDRSLTILWANRAAAESINSTPDELVGHSCHKLWYNRAMPCDSCPVLKTFVTATPQSEVITSPDNRILEVRTVPLLDDQGIVAKTINVKRDITEHKKLEAQYLHAQKMESIGTMAGGVAHDFNNILTAILGFGQLALKHAEGGTPLQRHIQGILEAADRAANLTRELLLFSRKQKGELQTIDLNKIVDKTEHFLLRVIGEDIALTKLLYAAPLLILGDSNQLEQVLMNLAVNARDAMANGGKFTLTTERVNLNDEFVSAHGFGTPGEHALLRVSDTGSGMDRETLQRIFEPFFTTKEVGKGTGLGLSVVYGIVKQHDGCITVQSEPGTGTTFSIYLPLSETAPQKTAVEEKPSFEGGTETVLLAEDNDLVRQLVSTLLSGAGYTVIEAVDGEEAVTRFKENADSIQLLLFDLIMPKMNGKEAADEIHRISPEVKTIFTSGYSPEIAQMKAALDNNFHLVQKPVSPHVLLQKVRSVMDGTD